MKQVKIYFEILKYKKNYKWVIKYTRNFLKNNLIKHNVVIIKYVSKHYFLTFLVPQNTPNNNIK